jgi:hypothetical protein
VRQVPLAINPTRSLQVFASFPIPAQPGPPTRRSSPPSLKKLVPIVQRAQVDFLANPEKTNAFVLDLVKQYNTGWVYSPGLAAYAIDKMRSDFITNGPDQTLGNFDTARVQRMIDIVTPIFTAQRQPPKEGLKPEDIATNEFVDTSIGVRG